MPSTARLSAEVSATDGIDVLLTTEGTYPFVTRRRQHLGPSVGDWARRDSLRRLLGCGQSQCVAALSAATPLSVQRNIDLPLTFTPPEHGIHGGEHDRRAFDLR